MKLGLYSDTHFSKTSSIVNDKGKDNFSSLLSNLIDTFNWMNQFFKEQGVDHIVCLGDLVDKPILNSEEITAMSRCCIDSHYIVLGNHCRSDKDGNINSVSNFSKVVNRPGFLFDDVYVLPYSHDLVDLRKLNPRPRIILSHNDIKGYSLGGHILNTGYELSDILSSCDLFINGHLHNGGWVVKDRVVNLGSLSGMNFSSCGGEWEPSVAILDTDSLEINFYENPKAFRFKKVEFDSLPKVKQYLSNLSDHKYVIQIKVPSRISDNVRKLINQCNKVKYSRVIVYSETHDKSEKSEKIDLTKSCESIFDKLRKYLSIQSDDKFDESLVDKVIDRVATMTEGENE